MYQLTLFFHQKDDREKTIHVEKNQPKYLEDMLLNSLRGQHILK